MSALWSYDELKLLKGMGRRGHSLKAMAQHTGHTRAETDLALWALVGRTLEQACDVLNIPVLCGEGDGGVRSPVVTAR
jgi:hypothetical protein